MLLHRLSPLDTWRANLQFWAVSHGATAWMIDLEAYEPCTVAGIPVHWTIEPRKGFIEATVFDGTGEVVARWPVWRRPSPLQLTSQGRGVVLRGVPLVGPEGELMLLDPDFSRAEFPSVA